MHADGSEPDKAVRQQAAVDTVSLAIEAGSFVGVIGRSGAGKSTLLRMLNRLQDPSEGSIRWKDQDVTALNGQELARLAHALRHGVQQSTSSVAST